MPSFERKRKAVTRKTYFFEDEGALKDFGLWRPNIDLCETSDAVTVKVDLPGVRPSDVAVSIGGGVLQIRGNKPEPQVAQRYVCYLCLERSYGRFLREVNLHWTIDARRARATLKDGILMIEIPKAPDRRGQAIEIPISEE
ncbi:MAG: Hsp20/alpha crystallin family protein [Acidobacteriota bacterium]